MRHLEFFTLSHQDYFEPLSRLPTEPLFRDRIRPLLPPSWEIERYEVWWSVRPKNIEMIRQGFKIHVSATPLNALEVIDRVVPLCVEEATSFKLVADFRFLQIVGSKNFGRGSAGKFFTIYPQSLETFSRLIEKIHQRTSELAGPYILSDKRYKASRVVFYRYGGFLSLESLNLDGSRALLLQKPDGTTEVDQRLPYFRLPEWVDDPVADQEETKTSSDFLKDRYEVIEALAFSNRGGIYKALDHRTQQQVLIKEARPMTANWKEGEQVIDAIDQLHHEHHILSRLQGLEVDGQKVAPDVVDFFKEWEHEFLVQEFIEGRPLSQQRAKKSVSLLGFGRNTERTQAFCSFFRSVARDLIRKVEAIHQSGILIGDLSPNNVLIAPESLRLTLIDFESALDLDQRERSESRSGFWGTPGFIAPDRHQRGTLETFDDHYALGMLLFSLLLPVEPLFELEPEARPRFLERIAIESDLPQEVEDVISALLNHDPGQALRILENWRIDESIQPRHGEAYRHDRRVQLVEELPEVLAKLEGSLLESLSPERKDRLFPGDFTIFSTNPISLAYGAGGPLILLRALGSDVPKTCTDWFLATLQQSQLPPGISTGRAGIAWTLDTLGFHEVAREQLEMARHCPLIETSADIVYGRAGWILAALRHYRRSQTPELLASIAEMASAIIDDAELTADGCFWKNPVDQRVHYGWGHGASGIALALLRCHQVTGESSHLEAAQRALDFDLAAQSEFFGLPHWPRFEKDLQMEPYLLHGSAGIGAVVLRFALALDDEKLLAQAERIAESSFSRLAVLPGQFEGLAGIGEFLLDLHVATGKPSYLHQSLEIADSLLQCYAIERNGGLTFPGRFLLRISTDFAYGSSGVGWFLKRVIDPGARLFFDLDA